MFVQTITRLGHTSLYNDFYRLGLKIPSLRLLYQLYYNMHQPTCGISFTGNTFSICDGDGAEYEPVPINHSNNLHILMIVVPSPSDQLSKCRIIVSTDLSITIVIIPVNSYRFHWFIDYSIIILL